MRPSRTSRIAAGLAFAAASVAGLRAEPRWAVRRFGATFNAPYITERFSDGTMKFMVENRMVDWRKTQPIYRVRESIHSLHHHRNWKVRRAAVDDLLWHPSLRVEEALIRGLRDPHLAVRERVVIALGEVGTNLSVLPLIDSMNDSPGPIRDTINHSLYRLTGEYYGRHRDRWMRWWETNRDLLR